MSDVPSGTTGTFFSPPTLELIPAREAGGGGCEILLQKLMDSPCGRLLASWVGQPGRRTVGATGRQGQVPAREAGTPRKTPKVRGTDCPRASLLSSPSFALAGAKRTHVPGPRALGRFRSWLIGPWCWRTRNKQASKPRTWLADKDRSFTSVPSPCRTYKTLVPSGR